MLEAKVSVGPKWSWGQTGCEPSICGKHLFKGKFSNVAIHIIKTSISSNDLNPLYLLYLNVYAVSTQFLLPFSY